MDRVSEVVFNPCNSIRHVHCCITDSDQHFVLKDRFLKMNMEKDPEWLVALTSCKYADSVPLLLQSLGASLNIKKESCKNVEDFMEAVFKVMTRLGRKHVILGIFGAEDLASCNHSGLSAFLAIPASFPYARILTISEVPWGFTEHIDAAGSSQPVELFADEYFAETEASLVASLTTELEIPKQIVRLVVQTLFAHIVDKKTIAKICKDTADFCASTPFATEKEKMSAAMAKVRSLMRNYERRTLLLRDDENDSRKADVARRLSICHQLLLLSSFCASHNTAAGDKRFFVKHHGREQRNDNKERAVELAAEHKDGGPKAVDVQRICFIYRVFLQLFSEEIEKKFEFKLPLSLDYLPELNSLEMVSLVSRASSFANMDQPKFKCMLSFETAKKIAGNLGIVLEDFSERRMM